MRGSKMWLFLITITLKESVSVSRITLFPRKRSQFFSPPSNNKRSGSKMGLFLITMNHHSRISIAELQFPLEKTSNALHLTMNQKTLEEKNLTFSDHSDPKIKSFQVTDLRFCLKILPIGHQNKRRKNSRIVNVTFSDHNNATREHLCFTH